MKVIQSHYVINKYISWPFYLVITVLNFNLFVVGKISWPDNRVFIPKRKLEKKQDEAPFVLQSRI